MPDGARTVPISPDAADVLASIPRVEGNPWVIPGRLKGKRLRNLDDPWELIGERAKLENMRLHDCRHSFASRALVEGLPMIGKLLGHTQVETTADHAHLARHPVTEAAVRSEACIAGELLATSPGSSSAVPKGGRPSQSGRASNGLIAGMPSGAKCRTFRVRTIRSWTPAVAAMARSA